MRSPDEAEASVRAMLHFAGHPTRVGSQEFTHNVYPPSGSQHKSSAKAQVRDISLRPSPKRAREWRFRHNDDVFKPVEVERDDALL
jgi:hypothetical protein